MQHMVGAKIHLKLKALEPQERDHTFSYTLQKPLFYFVLLPHATGSMHASGAVGILVYTISRLVVPSDQTLDTDAGLC